MRSDKKDVINHPYLHVHYTHIVNAHACIIHPQMCTTLTGKGREREKEREREEREGGRRVRGRRREREGGERERGGEERERKKEREIDSQDLVRIFLQQRR